MLPALKHLQLRVRGEAKAWSADRTSTHPLPEACTVSAQGARQRRLLREAAVFLPQLAHLRILPGRCSAQLLDLGHLRTTCSPSHAALGADRRSLARMPGICAASSFSRLCLPPVEAPVPGATGGAFAETAFRTKPYKPHIAKICTKS